MRKYKAHFLWLPVLLTCVSGASNPTLAQTTLSSAELGQVADEVVNQVTPPYRVLSRVPVSARKVFLDKTRTLEAFGMPASTRFDVQGTVRPGQKALLKDCPLTTSPTRQCQSLGWGVYVWIHPVWLTPAQLLVRAEVLWPDRLSARFAESRTPKGRAVLVGFAQEIYLTRATDGKWQYQRPGGTVAY